MKTTETKKTSKTDTKKVASKSNAADDLREFFMDMLKDIYWAEKALTKAIPKMSKNASSEVLIEGLNAHLTETEEHVKRLEEVFNILGKKAVAKKCDAMEGLIKEGQSIVEETKVGPVRDAGIIAAAQKIEHYEIATYGTIIAYAKTLGETKIAEILVSTLQEEKNADETLTEAAYNSINFEAAHQD